MPDFAHELRHHPGLVAGVDEAGRGPLAGPVVAAAVILRQEDCPDGLNDSKQLSAAKRAVLEGQIKARALCWGLGVASVEEIDSLNILWATMLAMTRAVEALTHDCAHVLVDGNRCPQWRWASTAVVEGDAKCLSIAAASISSRTPAAAPPCKGPVRAASPLNTPAASEAPVETVTRVANVDALSS